RLLHPILADARKDMASVDAGGVERFSDDRLVVELLCVTPHAGEGGLAVALEISLFGGDHGAAHQLQRVDDEIRVAAIGEAVLTGETLQIALAMPPLRADERRAAVARCLENAAEQHRPVFGARAGPAQQLREPAISEVGIGAAIVEIELDRRVHQPLPLSSKTELC